MSEPVISLVTTWTHPYAGGVSTHMSLLARALQIPEDDIISFHRITRQGAGVFSRTRRYALSKWRRESVSAHAEMLLDLLRTVDCDIVHCHDPMATWAAGVARAKFKKRYRIVSTVHGPVSRHMVEHGSEPCSPEVLTVQTREREAWQYADQIIAVDSTQRQICIEQGASDNKLSVIPNAVDLDEVDAKLRLLRLTPEERTHWLLVPRRLAPKNGVTHAIHAMRFLPPNVKLWVAGNGIEEQACRRAISEHQLHDRVAMLGGVPRDVVFMLSSAAAATIIPSVPAHGIVEATSIAGLEAMACRVPVVASAIGGLLEIIENNESGVLVTPGAPEEIADSVMALLQDPARRKAIGEAARKRVEKLYSLPTWMDAIRAVYREALSSSQP